VKLSVVDGSFFETVPKDTQKEILTVVFKMHASDDDDG